MFKTKKILKKKLENLKNLRKKMNLIFGPYCGSALFMLHIQKFRVQNINISISSLKN